MWARWVLAHRMSLMRVTFSRTSFASSRLCRRRLMTASVRVSPYRNRMRAGILKSLFTSRVIPASAVRV